MKNKIEKVIGIDLGTTNSCVSIMEGKEVKIIENAEGKRTTPSVVAFDKEGSRIVGTSAKRQAVTNSEKTVFAAKRLIGKKYNEISKKDLNILPYRVVEGEKGKAVILIDEKKVSPEEISAHILRKLKEYAENYLNESISKAVITVPAYFNNDQRQATKDAAKIAGLDALRLINEPTAAAVAYGMNKSKDNSKIAVYDLGGGTFDISIVEVSDGVVEVKSTNGDTHLGGEDFDNTIIEYLVSEFKASSGVDISDNKVAMQRVREEAEKAKIELSSIEKTSIDIPFLGGQDKHMRVDLSRAKLESLVDNLIEKTISPCQKAMDDAGLSKGDISEVILVGGMTRMPKVIKKVESFFDCVPSRNVNPDEVVSAGAAVQGGILSGADMGDMLLLDVTSLTLGIETQGGIMTPLIERNTTIPTKKSQIFSTAADNQTRVTIRVLQGERSMAVDNHLLGEFNLDGIDPQPKGLPQIEVTFDIDSDGIINVHAKDLKSGKEKKVTVESKTMNKEEIEKMLKEAEEYAETDKKKKEIVQVKNEAEGIIFTTEKKLKEKKDMPVEEKGKVEKKIEELKKSLATDDVEQIRNKINDLTNLVVKMAEKDNTTKKENK